MLSESERRFFRSGKTTFHPEAVTEGQSRDCAETNNMYIAQVVPQIDAAGAEKDPFRM